MFDKRVVERLEDCEGDFFVACSFVSIEDGFQWAFVGVYGPNLDVERRSMWEELAGILKWWELPSCLAGDFNVSRFPSERGAALLVEAADMGDPDAQYELGCRLRVENNHVQSDQQAFYYLEKAVDQLHPGALYLLGAVYLTGDCVRKDIASALWCFHRASEKGHSGAAIAYGSLLLRGAQVPESLMKFGSRSSSAKARNSAESPVMDPVEMAKKQFQIAATAGCDLGLKWLDRLEEEEKRLLAG
ncbi:uncharacterized protein LOC122313450 isoform X2 [Carya illinoinensis]|uniref:uncharacterized protein LOC122313450 isoform X2 n=1 Tax=Carya illinoinensis TaxID=32201 RepID=UPI001C72303D|nr:uncharacterized protein LOC122313450 isoform X2 [Carya illinoinensis]